MANQTTAQNVKVLAGSGPSARLSEFSNLVKAKLSLKKADEERDTTLETLRFDWAKETASALAQSFNLDAVVTRCKDWESKKARHVEQTKCIKTAMKEIETVFKIHCKKNCDELIQAIQFEIGKLGGPCEDQKRLESMKKLVLSTAGAAEQKAPAQQSRPRRRGKI